MKLGKSIVIFKKNFFFFSIIKNFNFVKIFVPGGFEGSFNIQIFFYFMKN